MPEDESIVLKPRELFSDAILPQNADELAKFMDQPQVAIAEAITGALAAGPKAWTLMTGHIVQGILKGKLYQQLGREIKDLREKGKIPDDFADEKQKYGFKSWVELLTVIDEQTPDADRLEALKAMFYAVNRASATDGERIVSYQLFQIAKKLTSGELLLLRAIFDRHDVHSDYTSNPPQATEPLLTWASRMAKSVGHGLSAPVLNDERALILQGLISEHLNSDTLRLDQQQVFLLNGRLTDLGMKFCTAIQTYHIEASGS
jgi:hypothetical protein